MFKFLRNWLRPQVEVLFKREFPDAVLPVQAYPGDAGLDLSAYLSGLAPVVLKPGERKLFGCGFSMALPEGWEAQVRPRSGNALKKGLGVLNSPGTVDSNFRGIVCVILINHSNIDVIVAHGDKIAQLVIAQAPKVIVKEVGSLPESERGGRGFGSSDKPNAKHNPL